MPGERQLLGGREDPDTVVGLRIRWREEERGLGQVGPVRKLLHPGGAEPGGFKDDGERIAAEGLGTEHINLGERAVGRGSFGSHYLSLVKWVPAQANAGTARFRKAEPWKTSGSCAPSWVE